MNPSCLPSCSDSYHRTLASKIRDFANQSSVTFASDYRNFWSYLGGSWVFGGTLQESASLASEGELTKPLCDHCCCAVSLEAGRLRAVLKADPRGLPPHTALRCPFPSRPCCRGLLFPQRRSPSPHTLRGHLRGLFLALCGRGPGEGPGPVPVPSRPQGATLAASPRRLGCRWGHGGQGARPRRPAPAGRPRGRGAAGLPGGAESFPAATARAPPRGAGLAAGR